MALILVPSWTPVRLTTATTSLDHPRGPLRTVAVETIRALRRRDGYSGLARHPTISLRSFFMTGAEISVQLFSVRNAITSDLPGAILRIAELGYTIVMPIVFVDMVEAFGI